MALAGSRLVRSQARVSSHIVNEDHWARLRREYEAQGLDEEEMADDPILQFQDWFEAVELAGIEEPNAFVLATVDREGRPSARAVLMKGLTDEGLVFYTNLESRKSQDLRANGLAAATFVWIRLHRQVRFEGTVEQVSDQESDRYFAERPRGAQIAAHASRQSSVISSRGVLDATFAELEASFAGKEVDRPEWWGGWLIRPVSVEFWQGQPNRFHDRVRYVMADDKWKKERLAP
jgi:pyridoxamine 5'-phosphate oxidase